MTPEAYLNKTAKKYFKRIEGILDSRNQADESYSTILSILCSEMAKYEEAMIEGEKEGLINNYKNGPSVNGYYTIANSAFSNVRQMCSKFGLTPADFVEVKKKDPKPKGLTALMNKKQA